MRATYYTNESNVEAIRNANIALMSDAWNSDSVLKATILQARANTNNLDKSKHKNYISFKLIKHSEYKYQFIKTKKKIIFLLYRFSMNTELKNMITDRKYNGAIHADILPYMFL